jgi:hypothetical protein
VQIVTSLARGIGDSMGHLEETAISLHVIDKKPNPLTDLTRPDRIRPSTCSGSLPSGSEPLPASKPSSIPCVLSSGPANPSPLTSAQLTLASPPRTYFGEKLCPQRHEERSEKEKARESVHVFRRE